MIAKLPKDLPIYDRAVERYPHLAHTSSIKQFCSMLCSLAAVDDISPLEYYQAARVAEGAEWEVANPKYRPQARYEAKTRVRVVVNLNANTDQDILGHLDKIDNVQGYIKNLIRADIAKTAIKKAGE